MNTPDTTPITVFDPKKSTKPGEPLILGNTKEESSRIIQADSSGNITKEPTPQAEVVLQPFSDGSLFRYVPTGKPDGSQFLVDANNQTVGLIRNQFLADFICRGVFLFFTALKQQQSEKNVNPLPIPVENNLPAEGSELS